MIRQATQNDYIRLLRSIQNKKESKSYINREYLQSDIANHNCYIKEENGQILAMISLIFDNHYQSHYLKRLIIPNKKNRGKNISEEMIRYFQDNFQYSLSITPWENNIPMRKIIEKLGFKFQYKFLEKYMLYTYH